MRGDLWKQTELAAMRAFRVGETNCVLWSSRLSSHFVKLNTLYDEA